MKQWLVLLLAILTMATAGAQQKKNVAQTKKTTTQKAAATKTTAKKTAGTATKTAAKKTATATAKTATAKKKNATTATKTTTKKGCRKDHDQNRCKAKNHSKESCRRREKACLYHRWNQRTAKISVHKSRRKFRSSSNCWNKTKPTWSNGSTNCWR